jgi:hypothetical protein
MQRKQEQRGMVMDCKPLGIIRVTLSDRIRPRYAIGYPDGKKEFTRLDENGFECFSTWDSVKNARRVLDYALVHGLEHTRERLGYAKK